jgi:hypothetical protein
MDQKDLRRLRRTDLLELLLDLSRENEILRQENQELLQQLEDRRIVVENSGSLAEAALQLSGIFEAAQNACEQYIQNMQIRSEQIEEYCRQREQQTREICDEIVEKAREEALYYLEQDNLCTDEWNERFDRLSGLMNSGR